MLGQLVKRRQDLNCCAVQEDLREDLVVGGYTGGEGCALQGRPVCMSLPAGSCACCHDQVGQQSRALHSVCGAHMLGSASEQLQQAYSQEMQAGMACRYVPLSRV